ncbi:MAG TPA: PQQ-dependent sugar dehydrogenase [Longimicrobiales bacterium]|nr:PQQ-dependent sugar dehydrogenase [Longimicrobiales bacterium]
MLCLAVVSASTIACDSASSTPITPDPDPELPDPPIGPPPPDFPTIPASGAPVFTGDGVQVVPIASGLEHPWGLAFLPTGELLVTERAGRLRVVRDGVLQTAPVTGLPDDVRVDGQAGLLDLALHPDFWTDSLVYMTYAAFTGGGVTTRVARARWDGEGLVGIEEVWTGIEAEMGGSNRHFGSRIVFDEDGYLYVSMGDRGTMTEGQDRSNHQGSVSRIHDDGSIPDDNPFANASGRLRSIYAFGMRNPQGLAIHPGTGALFESEHGPRYGDEVNVIEAGDNLGWAAFSYGTNYDGSAIGGQSEPPGTKAALVHWANETIAPSGIDFYTGDAFPEWDGDLFVAGLAARAVIRVDLNGEQLSGTEHLLGAWGKRIRHVRNGPDGFLYILTDESDGGIYRLEPVTD